MSIRSAKQSVLDRAESIQKVKKDTWEAIFGHISMDPDECGNLINTRMDKYRTALMQIAAYGGKGSIVATIMVEIAQKALEDE